MAGTGDWQLRVVPNLYPALLPAAAWQPPDGIVTRAIPARGWHEVVIESPRHLRRLTELTPEAAALVLQAYRDRFRVFANDPQMACGLAFKNCGRQAGMSQEHIHSQLVALPFLPPVLETELLGARKFHQRSGQCVFCHLAESEQRDSVRLIRQTEHFLAICPYASRAPYETWVLPRHHWARFEQTPTTQLAEFAQLLQQMLRCLEDSLGHPAYNYVLHSCPFDTQWEDHYHWHFEIIPRIAHLAGLEWGTGVHVNIVSPEVAAQTLRESA
jgi:UDPglucose--hexose-1-phosphate uridylyltransferase